jgi:hypothetical protein
VDALGKFKFYTERPGLYKLSIFHINFSFEPVVIEILSHHEIAENPN